MDLRSAQLELIFGRTLVQGRTDSSQPYGGPSHSLNPRSPERTRGSWRTRGGLLTRESPQASIPQEIRPTFGGWAAQ